MMSSYDTGVAFDAEGNEIKKFSGGGDHHHYANFVEAVRARDYKKLNADVEQGHLSSALCHLGNISLRLGKPIAGADVPAAIKENKGHEDMVATFKRTADHLKANELDPDKLSFSVGPLLQDGRQSRGLHRFELKPTRCSPANTALRIRYPAKTKCNLAVHFLSFQFFCRIDAI